MNKTELIKSVAKTTKLSQEVVKVTVNELFEEITSALAKGESVQLVGFGTFEVRERAARTGRNPKTGEDIQIPASRLPAFKAGKTLKDIVNS